MSSSSDNDTAIALLQEYDPESDGQGFSVSQHDQQHIMAIQRKLIQHNFDVYLLQPKGNDLEQLFIDLITAQ